MFSYSGKPSRCHWLVEANVFQDKTLVLWTSWCVISNGRHHCDCGFLYMKRCIFFLCLSIYLSVSLCVYVCMGTHSCHNACMVCWRTTLSMGFPLPLGRGPFWTSLFPPSPPSLSLYFSLSPSLPNLSLSSLSLFPSLLNHERIPVHRRFTCCLISTLQKCQRS